MLRVFSKSMKFLLCAISALLLDIIGSCSHDFLKVKPNTVTLDSHRDSTTIKVSSNVKWKIIGACSWLEVSPTSGSGDAVISITAQPNESDSWRSYDIAIDGDSWRAYETVVVNQMPNPDFLSVYPSYVLLDVQGDSATIEVSSNIEWKITGNDSWLDVNPASGNGDAVIIITAQPNESSYSRSSNIVIHGGDMESKVQVHQRGKAIADD